MAAAGFQMKLLQLRRRWPDATEADIQAKLEAWLRRDGKWDDSTFRERPSNR